VRLFYLLFTLFLIAGFAPDAQAAKNHKYASFVMDAETGMILHQRYADKVLHPASLTKMMTLLMVFEAIDKGDLELSDRITMTKHAASMIPSKIGLPAGATIRVEDAIYSLVTKSANDVAAAIGDHLAGSEDRFGRLMTSRARDIGMSNTTFRNASGLHDPKQVSTARDMAKLARYMLVRYPHYYDYFSTRQFTYRGKTYNNHNRLMNSYEGMDGFKTGYISASGFNLVASAVRGNRRIIGVVFGGRSSQTRNAHMAELLDKGFDRLKDIRIAQAPVPPRKPHVITASAAGSSSAFNSFTSLSSLERRSQRSPSQQENYTALTRALQSGAFGEMIGQGDYDPAITKRLETGLIAVSVHKGEYEPDEDPPTHLEKSIRNVGHAVLSRMISGQNNKKVSEIEPEAGNTRRYRPASFTPPNSWSIQIGAYTSRVATDQALANAIKQLPSSFSSVRPSAVPLRTAEGVLFRARLNGLSQSEAVKACRYFRDCLTIAPQ